ncbi:hypothetical protein C8F01DRAFT_1263011 [Mycena amicta]|nr:hypothetical protein C8F01DRAFT_1263393 [Mycena amicta]KAJ7051416.1 hypothetical protein C8F01DRAFT_1263011 [Mycena amicta]
MSVHLESEIIRTVHDADPHSPVIFKICVRLGMDALFWAISERDGSDVWAIVRPLLDSIDTSTRYKRVAPPSVPHPRCERCDSAAGHFPMGVWLNILRYLQSARSEMTALANPWFQSLVVQYMYCSRNPFQRASRRQFLPDVAASRVPEELWLEVIKNSDVVSLGHLATTGSWWRNVIHETIDRAMRNFFTELVIDYDALRWCLTMTRAILADTAALRLLRLEDGKFNSSDVHFVTFFVPGDGVGWSGHHFLSFFKHAMGWQHDVVRPSPIPSISETVYLVHPLSAFRVRVHVCVGELPLMVAMRTGLTTQFVAYDGHRLIVPHYATSVEGIALPNKSYLPLPREDLYDGQLRTERAAMQEGVRLLPFSLAAPRVNGVYTTSSASTGICAYRPLAWGCEFIPKDRSIIWRLAGRRSPFFVALAPRDPDEWQLDGEDDLELKWDRLLVDPASVESVHTESEAPLL